MLRKKRGKFSLHALNAENLELTWDMSRAGKKTRSGGGCYNIEVKYISQNLGVKIDFFMAENVDGNIFLGKNITVKKLGSQIPK